MQSFEKFIGTPIAHRGLHDEIREENSISAFKAAIERGFAIETDVHLLRDGVVAVHHDNSLKRICGKDVRIESLTSSQLKDYPMTLGGEIIPTLPEMLALVDGRVPILIELKTICGWRNNDLAKAVLRDLKNYPYKDVIALQSFDPFAVRWCRRHQTEYPFGQLASAEGEKGKTPKVLNDFMGKLHVNAISKPMFTSYDVVSSPNKYIDKTHEKMPVLSWTVRTEENLAVAKKYADNVIFEKISPDIIKKELPFK
ncbi:MAG: glycerophosphodiester phosphodiesterase family protein [Christensenellales bacterium]